MRTRHRAWMRTAAIRDAALSSGMRTCCALSLPCEIWKKVSSDMDTVRSAGPLPPLVTLPLPLFRSTSHVSPSQAAPHTYPDGENSVLTHISDDYSRNSHGGQSDVCLTFDVEQDGALHLEHQLLPLVTQRAARITSLPVTSRSPQQGSEPCAVLPTCVASAASSSCMMTVALGAPPAADGAGLAACFATLSPPEHE